MNLLNIYFLVQEFYAIEAIVAMLSVKKFNNFEPMRHSHNRWYRDFNDFRDKYIDKFSSAICDYTALVVAAELRHCSQKASHYITDYYTTGLSRNNVYRECSVYKVNDILSAGIRMFDTERVRWDTGFGGDKWKQIAKAGLMKGKVSDCVFIDHCVDLSHNNSIYFDKCAEIFHLQDIREYQSFLDLKRSCKPQVLISANQGLRFNQLLCRANTLQIINELPIASSDFFARDEAEAMLFDYHPVVWGVKQLNFSERNITGRGNFRSNTKRREDSQEYLRCA